MNRSTWIPWRSFKCSNLKHHLSATQSKTITELQTAVTFNSLVQVRASETSGNSTRPDSGKLSPCPISRWLRAERVLAQLPIGRKVREALVLTITSMADCFLRDGGNDYRTLGLLLWRTNKTRGRLTQLLGSLTHCILFELLICWFIKLEVYYIGKWILPVFKCK